MMFSPAVFVREQQEVLEHHADMTCMGGARDVAIVA